MLEELYEVVQLSIPSLLAWMTPISPPGKLAMSTRMTLKKLDGKRAIKTGMRTKDIVELLRMTLKRSGI